MIQVSSQLIAALDSGIEYPALRRCVSFDLEVSPDGSDYLATAAYRPDTDASLSFSDRPNHGSLQQLDRFAEGASFLLGHNLIAHDLPFLANFNRHSQLLKLPVVDILHLNPLAFPMRPYHRLVKHYQDGGLVHRWFNDPLLDSKLAVEAFSNQLEKFRDTTPDLLVTCHWLTTVEDGEGFDAVFSAVRYSPAPTEREAKKAIGRKLEGQGCRFHTKAIVDR